MAILVERKHSLGPDQLQCLLRIRECILDVDAIMLFDRVKHAICFRVEATRVQTAPQPTTVSRRMQRRLALLQVVRRGSRHAAGHAIGRLAMRAEAAAPEHAVGPASQVGILDQRHILRTTPCNCDLIAKCSQGLRGRFLKGCIRTSALAILFVLRLYMCKLLLLQSLKCSEPHAWTAHVIHDFQR